MVGQKKFEATLRIAGEGKGVLGFQKTKRIKYNYDDMVLAELVR